ncbi:hypothetical protein [Paenibacillus agri]|uniref:Uncharacterized protein n=1 Tax=Paenibacillus agri TaxID=2744309 RepID=A0A850ETK6_9BACL|nr:hypothetical protein [Paenibacillus agri]NUU62674.1 hypothetical protein [Paenibacillus agri]
MTLKKIWRWIKVVYFLVFIFSIVALVAFLGILMFGALTDKTILVNTATINAITLIMGLVSLPGILVQLVSLLEINNKKTFTLEKKCPNCKQLIELKLTED